MISVHDSDKCAFHLMTNPIGLYHSRSLHIAGVFCDGQAYVALSRASNENGLELLGFNPALVRCHWKAKRFYDDKRWKPRLWNEKALAINGGELEEAPPPPRPGSLAGLAIVFTGEFGTFDRMDSERLVEACGGVTRNSVSGKTNLLVVGSTLEDGRAPTETQKHKKAMEIINGANNKTNLRVINKSDFFALIKGTSKVKSTGARSSILARKESDSGSTDNMPSSSKQSKPSSFTSALAKTMSLKSNATAKAVSASASIRGQALDVNSFSQRGQVLKDCPKTCLSSETNAIVAMKSESRNDIQTRQRLGQNGSRISHDTKLKHHQLEGDDFNSGSSMNHNQHQHIKQDERGGLSSGDETQIRANGKRGMKARSAAAKSAKTNQFTNNGTALSRGSKKEQQKRSDLNANKRSRFESSSSEDDEEMRRVMMQRLGKAFMPRKTKRKLLASSSSDDDW